MQKKLKNILVISIIFSFIFLSFSGCIKQEDNKSESSIINIDNNPPNAVINCPSQAYFNELIDFDASQSNDQDGEIVSYKWDFRDGNTAEGKTVSHKFNFDNDYFIEYPVIYTISLLITDDEGNIIIENKDIKLYPKKYILYLDKNTLIPQLPIEKKQDIKINRNGLFSSSKNEIIYNLTEPILIPKCSWNLSLYLQKPIMTVIKELKLILTDDSGNEISKSTISYNSVFQFWTDKKIIFKNTISKDTNFKSVKLEIVGNSYNKAISLRYGSEYPSNICLTFNAIDW